MKTQLPVTTEGEQGEHRVLKFRPRSSRPPHQRDDALDRRRQDSSRQDHSRPDHTRQEPAQQEANDFSHFERDRQPPDDFHHRMLANTAALAFTIALTAIGVWLAMSIADLRKTQDCVLMGRRGCAQISSPHS